MFSALQKSVYEAAKKELETKSWYQGVCTDDFPQDAQIRENFQDCVDFVVRNTAFYDAVDFLNPDYPKFPEGVEVPEKEDPQWVLFMPEGAGWGGHNQVSIEVRGEFTDEVLEPLIDEAMTKWRGFNQGRHEKWRLIEFWGGRRAKAEVEVFARHLAETLGYQFIIRPGSSEQSPE